MIILGLVTTQLLSEFVILSVASGVLLYEYNRQSEKEEAKQAMVESEKRELRETVDHLTFAVEQQAAQVRELSRITVALHEDLSKKTGVKPSASSSSLFGGGKDSSAKNVNCQDGELAITTHKKPGQILAAVHELNLRSI